MPFMVVWLRLTIMKLARRKNMMSINGMISMRAFLCGMGEARFMRALDRGSCRWAWSCRRDFTFFGRVFSFQHNFEVRRSRLQFELQVRHARREKVKRNQRENRD